MLKQRHTELLCLSALGLRNVMLTPGVFGNVTVLSSQTPMSQAALREGFHLLVSSLKTGFFNLLSLKFDLPRMTFLFPLPLFLCCLSKNQFISTFFTYLFLMSLVLSPFSELLSLTVQMLLCFFSFIYRFVVPECNVVNQT